MDAEQWTMVATLLGPLSTAVVAIVLAKINQQNLRQQREADDLRAVSNHRRARHASLADERASRLRADAAEFMAALDKSWRTVEKGEGQLMVANWQTKAAQSGEEDYVSKMQHKMFAPFMVEVDEGTLEHRLSIAGARLSLFGGEVALTAGQAQLTLLERQEALIENMSLTLAGQHLTDEQKVWRDTPDSHAHRETEIETFVAAVRRVERAILSHPEG